MFNTLKYAKMLEAAGFSREQAETSIKILVEIMEEKLATKQDIRDLESRLTLRMRNDVGGLGNASHRGNYGRPQVRLSDGFNATSLLTPRCF